MSPGGPDVKAIFTEALEHPAGPAREAYLAAACGGDATLRGRVEELLAAYGQASDVLGPSDSAATSGGEGEATGVLSTRPWSGVTTAAPHPDPPPTGGEGTIRKALPPGGTIREALPPGGGGLGEWEDHGILAGPLEPTDAGRKMDHGETASPSDATRPGPNGGGLPPGTAVRYFGDYEIRRELGRGGMGVVYEALQLSLNRPVALKMVKAGLLAGDDELRRFRNEAEAVALLDHPGIVPVHEVGEHQGQHYFSMKLVPGGSLVPLLGRYKDDPKAAAKLVAEAAEAVAHAHMRGILHRDLKPANILVDDQGHPHVTDFGLAKKVEADVEFTQSGAILGTPAYMSPEQATGRRGSITTATDVYGLGAVLYALLTGQAPFGGDSVVETIDAVRNAPPEPPRSVNAAVPRDLETICLKCLEKDPRRRYASAQALADDLRAWLESRPIAARRVGSAERAWLWCKRKPAVAALSAAVLLALLGGTATVIAVQAKANADLRAANRRVEQRYELAVDAIKTFHTGVSEDFLLKQEQFKELRDRLLKSAADFYGKLSAVLDRDTDAASRRALAHSNYELANLTRDVGRNEAALAAHRAVLAAREALASEPGADAAAKADIGRSLTAVAGLLALTGKTDEALAAYRRSEAVLEGPAGSDPWARAALAACRSALASVLSTTGKPTDALAIYRRALTDQEELASSPGASNDARRDLARMLTGIGVLLKSTGNLAEAEASYRRALAEMEKLVEIDPSSTRSRSYLGDIHTNLGDLLATEGRQSEAEPFFRAALEVYRKLADDQPAVTQFRNRLANGHNNLGALLSEMGKQPEAVAELRETLKLRRKLADDHPTDTDLRNRLGQCHLNLGSALEEMGNLSGGDTECRLAVATYNRLSDDYPAITEFRYRLALSRSNLGWVLMKRGELSDAEAEFWEVQTLFRELAAGNPTVPVFRSQVAKSWYNLSVVLRRLGRTAEARDHCDRAVAADEALVKEHPKATVYCKHLAEHVLGRGGLRLDLGNLGEPAADLRRAVSLYDTLPSRMGDELFLHACSSAALAGLAGRPGSGVSAAEASSEAEKAAALLHKAAATGYRNVDAYRTDHALDPLRGRDDFQLLLMDLAFPAEPFERTEGGPAPGAGNPAG